MGNEMKATFISLLFLALGSTATYFYLSPQKDTHLENVFARQADVSDVKIADLARENEEYKNKIRTLESTNTILQAQLNRLVSAGRATTSSSASSNIDNDQRVASAAEPVRTFAEEVQHQQRALETAKEVSAYLDSFNSLDNGDINRDLAKKFQAETVDQLWAYDHERKLDQLFSSDKKLLEFVPEGIVCKTTRCQIKIPISSVEESNQVMDAISQALEGQDNASGLGKPMIITIPDPSVGFVDFYIARDESVKLYQ